MLGSATVVARAKTRGAGEDEAPEMLEGGQQHWGLGPSPPYRESQFRLIVVFLSSQNSQKEPKSDIPMLQTF